MNPKIQTLWMRNRWRIATVVFPLCVLFLGYSFLWKPMIAAKHNIDLQSETLRQQMADRASFARRLDTLERGTQVLGTFQRTLDSIRFAPVPGLDSLRRLAEAMGLTVQDLAQSKDVPSGYGNMGRMDLEGSFQSLVAFVDSLDSWHPVLQVERLQWVPGRKGDRVVLVFGELNPASHSISDSVRAHWQHRAIFAKHLAGLAPDSSAVPNPFRGHVVERPVVVRMSSAAVAPPKQPAPSFQIVGLVAGRMATVQFAGGERKLLRTGDSMGDWIVESISASSLILRNGADTKTYNTK